MQNVLQLQTWNLDERVLDETRLRVGAWTARALKKSEEQGQLIATHAFDEELVLPFTPLSRPPVTFVASNEWEGHVVTIEADRFTAQLIDITANRKCESELGEFYLDDLSEEDRENLREGSIFRWVVGYQKIRGTRQRVSLLHFRRIAKISARDRQKATDKARALLSNLGLA